MPKSRQGQRLESIADLAFLKDQLESQRLQEERIAQQEAQAKAEAEADSLLFQQFVEDAAITPLKNAGDRHFDPPKPEPLPLHSKGSWSVDLQAPKTQDNLSDHWDGGHLMQDKDGLYYHKPGIRLDSLKKLRKGQWIVQAQIDLHGHRVEEARVAVHEFVHACCETDLRCVRIVHGKGLSSANGEAVLKEKVKSWLVQIKQVLAFCQAPPKDGGDGALLILLKARKRLKNKTQSGD